MINFLQFFSKVIGFSRKTEDPRMPDSFSSAILDLLQEKTPNTPRPHAKITEPVSEQGDVISLLYLLNHQDEEIRFKARSDILEMDSKAFLILESCLSDQDPNRRYNAIIAIGDMLNHRRSYAEKAIPKLKQLARSDEDHVVAKTARKVLEIAFIMTKNEQLLL